MLVAAGRNETLARQHAGLLASITGILRRACALVQQHAGRGLFMTFLSASYAGAQLRALLSELHERALLLGAAASVSVPDAVSASLKAALGEQAEGFERAVRRINRGVKRSDGSSGGRGNEAVTVDSSRVLVFEDDRIGDGVFADVYAGALFSQVCMLTYACRHAALSMYTHNPTHHAT